MEVWAILVVGVLAGLGCSPEAAPRASPAATLPSTAPAPSVVDALIDYVPPQAFAVVAIDLAQARRSSALTRAVERAVTETGHDARTIATARALVIALVPGGAGESPSSLLIIAGPGEVELLGPPAAIERARAAHAEASLVELDAPRAALLAARGGTAGFVVVRMTESLRTAARTVLPDLATAAWFAGSLDVANGVAVTGIGAFPDLTTAARIAGSLDLGKSFALGELRSTDPLAARALGKLVARPVGSTLRVTATLDEAEAEAVFGLLR